MRTESLNGVLLSTLIIVSLMVPAIMFLSVSPASAQTENIIVRGDDDASTLSTEFTLPPWKVYQAGDNPPIMWAENVDAGRVVAAGFSRMTNGGEDYPDKKNWVLGELDVLFDVAFRWMKPDNDAPIKVLWYGENDENYNVFNDAGKASWLIDNLRAEGYVIDNTGAMPIDSSMLAPYDILVLPGLQIGAQWTGGAPENLPDDDVSAINNFVRGGKGLFIMDSGDWDGRNYYKVQNKILDKLDFSMLFQSDTVVDPDSLDPTYVREGMGAVFEADVTDVLFGADYIAATGKTKVQVYKVPSLAPEPGDYGVFAEIPRYLEGLAGGTFEYTVKVINVGNITDNYKLENSDTLGWELEISPSVLELENNYEPKYAKLTVKIPPGEPIGTKDVVTVTATSEDNDQVSHSAQSVAIVGNRVRPTTADAQVIEAEPSDKSGPKEWMYVGSSATGLRKNQEVFLKFDLRGMGTDPVENVRLYLYCFDTIGAPDKTVKLYSVDEPWWEDNIDWNYKPQLVNNLDNATVSDRDLWYSWDVTEYVGENRYAGQRIIDNLASFALSYETGSEDYPDNRSYGFRPKEFGENLKHPYLATGYSVSTEVREPKYKEGMRGGTLSCKVLVQNTGALWDNYKLTVGDNKDWGPKFLATGDNIMWLPLDPGKFDYATVTVTIPPGATIGENIDNLLVIATSSDPTVSDNDWFVVNVSETNIKPPEDDSTAKQAEPVGNCVWGTLDKIEVGRESGGPIRGFLKFDLSAIGTDIKRAKLWLNAEEVDDVGAVVRVHSVDDDSWIERSAGAGRLVWDNQPPIGEVLDVRTVVEADRKYFWDVTEFVKSQRDSDNVASFALVDLGENILPDLHTARFTSKNPKLREPRVIRENHPYLEILTTEPTYEVRAYISPIFQGGVGLETTLTYTVTVTNTGTLTDSYNLDVSDTESWDLSLENTSFEDVENGGSRSTTLSVTILSGEVCTLDRITVTVTGTGVSDDAMCFAHLSGLKFKLENLYKVKLLQKVGIEEISISLRLREDADNLVAKFYGYTNAYDNESVIWENMPWHLTGKPEVPHPEGFVAVENFWLVLVDGTGAEIATVATFTVQRSDLMGRLAAIDMDWPYYPELRPALMREIADIDMQWPYAPY